MITRREIIGYIGQDTGVEIADLVTNLVEECLYKSPSGRRVSILLFVREVEEPTLPSER